MLRKVISALLIGGAVTSFAAEKEGWELSIGASYRSFKDVDFKSFKLNNGNYVDGSVDGANIEVVSPSFQGTAEGPPEAGKERVALSKVSFGGESSDFDSAPGLVLGLSRKIGESEHFTYNLDLSVTWITTDMDETFNGSVEADVFMVDSAGWSYDAINDVYINGTAVVDPLVLENNRVKSTVRYDLSMDVFTFSAGVSAKMALGPVDVKAGIGPTLTAAGYDVSCDKSWSFVDDALNQYGGTESSDDDGAKLRLGLYANLALSVDITEQWAIEAGVRYDYIPVTVNTNVAEIDLSGMSTEIKAVYSF